MTTIRKALTMPPTVLRITARVLVIRLTVVTTTVRTALIMPTVRTVLIMPTVRVLIMLLIVLRITAPAPMTPRTVPNTTDLTIPPTFARLRPGDQAGGRA